MHTQAVSTSVQGQGWEIAVNVEERSVRVVMGRSLDEIDYVSCAKEVFASVRRVHSETRSKVQLECDVRRMAGVTTAAVVAFRDGYAQCAHMLGVVHLYNASAATRLAASAIRLATKVQFVFHES